MEHHLSQRGKAVGQLRAAPCRVGSCRMVLVPGSGAARPGAAGLGLSLPHSPVAPALCQLSPPPSSALRRERLDEGTVCPGVGGEAQDRAASLAQPPAAGRAAKTH